MKTLNFFDVNCRCGLPFNGGPGAASATMLIRDMDYYGVDRTLVRDINIAKGALNSNAEVARFISAPEATGRLYGVWCLLPEQCDEIPEPDAFFAAMKDAGIVALTLSPFEHKYIPNRLTIGRLMAAAAARRIPVLLDAFAGKFQELYDFAAEFPDNRLIYIERWGKWGIDRYIRPLLEHYSNFYFDLTGYWVPEGVRDLAERYGAERLLFGSGYPFYNQGSPMLMLKHAGLDDRSLRLIAGGNFQRLLDEVQL